MLIASVKAGHYLLIEGNTVVGSVVRTPDRSRYTYYPEYVYELTATIARPTGEIDKVSKIYRNLRDLNDDYEFENYPGYNAILKADRVSKRKKRYTDDLPFLR